MTENQDGAVRRAQIEAALAQYPDLERHRLEELIHWFRKEASARDVAMIACNEAVLEPYRRFRADHIDPLTARDAIRVVAILAAVGLAILLIAWRAL
jgi:hypothetical protein